MSTTRHGPRMLEAAAYVARHPGCAILPVARYVAPRGPHGAGRPGICYGYRTVHRAIRAGLILAKRARGRYTLMAPPSGSAL